MRFDRPLIVFLLLAWPAWGQVAIEGPKAAVDRQIVTLKATGVPEGGFCRWKFRPELPEGQIKVSEDRLSLQFTAKPGKYKIKVEANWYIAPKAPSTVPQARGADAALDIVVLAGVDDPVVPVPVDPAKPVPKPVDPVPLDPLAQQFQAAFAKDAEPDKIDLKKALADLYEFGASDATLTAAKTDGNLQKAMLDARKLYGFREGSLSNLQDAIEAYLADKLPPIEDAPITPARKVATKREFGKVSAALRAIR